MSRISPAKKSPGTSRLSIVCESTSSKATPPAVTSALLKPKVPLTGISNCLSQATSRCRSLRETSAARRSAIETRLGDDRLGQTLRHVAGRRCPGPIARLPRDMLPETRPARASALRSGSRSHRSTSRRGWAWPLTARLTSSAAGPVTPKWANNKRAPPLGQADRPGRAVAGLDHPHADVRQRDALQPEDPRGVGRDRHQGGPRRNDRMPKLGRPTVAIARRTAAGIRLPSGREDDGLRPQRPLGSDDPQAARIGRDRLHGLVGGQRAAAAAESCQQCSQNVVGPIAHGEDFSARLDLGGNAFGFDQIDELIGSQGGQGRMEKRPLGAKGLDETADIQGVRQVAARPAGHEDFGTGTFFLLQEERPPPPLGRSAGRHQTGRPSSNDDDFPVFHAVMVSGDPQVAASLLVARFQVQRYGQVLRQPQRETRQAAAPISTHDTRSPAIGSSRAPASGRRRRRSQEAVCPTNGPTGQSDSADRRTD